MVTPGHRAQRRVQLGIVQSGRILPSHRLGFRVGGLDKAAGGRERRRLAVGQHDARAFPAVDLKKRKLYAVAVIGVIRQVNLRPGGKALIEIPAIEPLGAGAREEVRIDRVRGRGHRIGGDQRLIDAADAEPAHGLGRGRPLGTTARLAEARIGEARVLRRLRRRLGKRRQRTLPIAGHCTLSHPVVLARHSRRTCRQDENRIKNRFEWSTTIHVGASMHDRPCIMGQTFLFVSAAQFSHAVILTSHLGKRQNGQCRLIVWWALIREESPQIEIEL